MIRVRAKHAPYDWRPRPRARTTPSRMPMWRRRRPARAAHFQRAGCPGRQNVPSLAKMRSRTKRKARARKCLKTPPLAHTRHHMRVVGHQGFRSPDPLIKSQRHGIRKAFAGKDLILQRYFAFLSAWWPSAYASVLDQATRNRHKLRSRRPGKAAARNVAL